MDADGSEPVSDIADYIECPCCGDVAAEGLVSDGDGLACGCSGHITVEEDGEAWANNYDDCPCDTLRGYEP